MSISINPEKSSFLRAMPRLFQILRVLARRKFLGVLRGKGHGPSPKEVRETFEELGLTFLKFGQVLAIRRDLLPDTYIKELELLHDQLSAMDFSSVRATIENELGDSLKHIFATFNETPIAAATIAQVHEATLSDGRRVAVKVQRPNLEEMIATDITALAYLVKLVEGLFPRLRALDLPVLVSEFAKSVNKETDFHHEANSISLFRTALADLPDLWIPDVLAEFSSESVLTMEFSTGERIDLYAKRHPEAMPKAIRTLVSLTLQTIFEEGLFHADPHPGNVLILPDGRLSLLDFGMTGELDEAMRESLTHLLGAVVKGDARAATAAYLEMAPQGSEKVNRAALLLDIKAVLYEIHRSDLAKVSIGKSFDSLLHAGSRHGVHNPGEFFLLTRTFVILEAMIRKLDPEHDYLGAFQEEITRLTKQHFSLERIKEKTGKLGHELERLASDGPGDLRQILRHLAEGNLGRVQAPAVEALGGRITRNLERLTMAIAAAALVIGGALLVEGRLGGWYHDLGEVMVISGISAMIIVFVGIVRGDQGRGRGRR
jgi:ubiquinone biosynthesis protein